MMLNVHLYLSVGTDKKSNGIREFGPMSLVYHVHVSVLIRG